MVPSIIRSRGNPPSKAFIHKKVVKQGHTQTSTCNNNSSKSNKVTPSQLTTQGQSFAANLASPEIMIEPVLNDDHTMVK
jgi:hypothetical protein